MSQICQPCGRRVQSVNNAVSECSRVECPHRRAQMWLDDLVESPHNPLPEPPARRLFDSYDEDEIE